MKRTIFAGMASALAIAAATPASAALFIGVGFNGGAITQVATDSGLGAANYVAIAGGYIYNSGATGMPILLQPNLLTQSINIKQGGTAGVLNLYITQTDLSAFSGLLTSSFTSNTVTNASATLSSYYSTSNALFGGTLLRSSTFSGTGTSANVNLLSLTGPFSTTVRYDISFGPGLGDFNGTANLLAVAVPEPATWAMMLIGFAGIGASVRSRKVRARINFA